LNYNLSWNWTYDLNKFYYHEKSKDFETFKNEKIGDIINSYTDKDINNANPKSEISFKCDAYYLLNKKYAQQVEDKLKLL